MILIKVHKPFELLHSRQQYPEQLDVFMVVRSKHTSRRALQVLENLLGNLLQLPDLAAGSLRPRLRFFWARH